MNDTKYEIPEDLRAAWDVLPQNCWERQLIERIAKLSAGLELIAEHRDKTLVSMDFAGSNDYSVGANRAFEQMAGIASDTLGAARQSAKEPPSPPATKERRE